MQRLTEIQGILKNIDIFICVETWLTEEKRIQFPGFSVFRKDRTHSRGGGLMLLIRNNLIYDVISDLNVPDQSVELCGISINNISLPLDLFVCYRAPGSTLSQENWDNIFQNVKSSHNTIILGDFNSHNKNWNCTDDDTNGIRLENSMEKNDLFLLNNNSLTYVNMYHKTKSNLDLLISSIGLSDKIDFKVSDDPLGSDHFPIFVKVNAEKALYHKKSFKIKSLRTNWDMFVSVLEDSYIEFLSSEYEHMSPNSRYEFFVSKVTYALKSSTPSKKVFHKNNFKNKNPVPWWDNECNKIKRLRKACYKKWEFTHTLEDLIDYKKTSAIAKKVFKIKKRDSFKKFAESINIHTDTKFVWNKCKIFKNKWVKIPSSFSLDNTQMKNKVHDTLNKISPPWVPVDPSWCPFSQDNDFFDVPFNFLEFNIAMDKKNDKSAPGLDGIDFETLKKLSLKMKLLLLDIFNALYQTNEYPYSWKESFIHFLNKSDNSVRPITLSSCFAKLFETLVKNRLQWWVETQNIIPSSQCGFRKGKSCIDNLSNLTLKVDQAFSEKNHVLAVFLDVQGAFDNVVIDGLLSKLASIGCSTKIIKFIKFMSYERFIRTAYTGVRTRCVYKGVPQGGVLSPLLYLLYVSDIVDGINKKVTISQFADDLAMYTKSKTMRYCKIILQKAVNKISQNLLKLGLELSPLKSHLLHFNNMKILPGNIEIKINDYAIKSSDSVKFLGIIFDYKMTFGPHIDQVKKKCSRALNIVKYLCGTWWGSSPETLLILYKSFVLSIIDYGSYIYFPSTKKASKKIEAIQNEAIRIALGYRRSTPIGILLAESKLMLLKERSNYLCDCYIAKIMSNSNSDVYKTINNYFNFYKKKIPKRKFIICQRILSLSDYKNYIDVQNNYNIYCSDYEVLTSSIPFDTSLGKDLNIISEPNSMLDDFVNKNSTFAIYTDGSKVSSNACVGAACICPGLGISIRKSITFRASVFTAECIALNESLNIALNHKYCNFLIFSDSLSALESLKSNTCNIKINKYVFEIKKKYIQFHFQNSYNTCIKFYWIPSHIGLRGNEDVDRLAKSATLLETVNLLEIPFTDLYETFKKSSYELTKNYALNQGLSKGKFYFENYYSDQRKTWFDHRHLSRKFIVTINRSRANHYSLAASLARIGIIMSAVCKCGCKSEDLNHVIWQCPLYNSQRLKLLKKLFKMRISLPMNIETLLIKPNIMACAHIISFLNECKLNI